MELNFSRAQEFIRSNILVDTESSNAIQKELSCVLEKLGPFYLNLISHWLRLELQERIHFDVHNAKEVANSFANISILSIQLNIAVSVLEQNESFIELLLLSIWIVDKCNQKIIREVAILVLRRHLLIFKCLGYTQQIIDTLVVKVSVY